MEDRWQGLLVGLIVGFICLMFFLPLLLVRYVRHRQRTRIQRLVSVAPLEPEELEITDPEPLEDVLIEPGVHSPPPPPPSMMDLLLRHTPLPAAVCQLVLPWLAQREWSGLSMLSQQPGSFVCHQVRFADLQPTDVFWMPKTQRWRVAQLHSPVSTRCYYVDLNYPQLQEVKTGEVRDQAALLLKQGRDHRIAQEQELIQQADAKAYEEWRSWGYFIHSNVMLMSSLAAGEVRIPLLGETLQVELRRSGTELWLRVLEWETEYLLMRGNLGRKAQVEMALFRPGPQPMVVVIVGPTVCFCHYAPLPSL